MSPQPHFQLALSEVLVEFGINLVTWCVTLISTSALTHNERQIVALNVQQFGSGYPGPYCFQPITISYNGQTIQATITDKVRSILALITCSSLDGLWNTVHGLSLGWSRFLSWFV